MNIEDLRNVFKSNPNNVEYKMHCLKRMLERNISRDDIAYCIMNGEIIENYPLNDNNTCEKSFPSYLILCINVMGIALHVVVGFNGIDIIIISAYHPDLEHWEKDFKTRKEL